MVSPPTPRLLLLLALAALTPRAADGAHTPRPHPAVVQALNPKGLRIAVLDAEGQDLVIVNANLNVPLEQKETGQFKQTVTRAADGFWTLHAADASIRPGDVVFYSAFVSIQDAPSRYINGHHVVEELIDPSCQPSPTTVNGEPACKGTLIFEDNFDTLNTSVWMHHLQFSAEPDHDFSTYVADSEHSFTRDGSLHLKATVLEEEELTAPAKVEGCTSWRGGDFCERKPLGWYILPPTRSAWISTRPSAFAFKYGRFEMRAKMAAGDWLQSKAYLEPRDYAYGRPIYNSGRLDLARVRGNADLRIAGQGENQGAALVEMRTGVASCYLIYWDWTVREMPDKLFSDDYHVFSTTWTPRVIKFEVDGQTLKTIRLPPGGRLDTEQYRNCKDSEWERGTAIAPFDQEFVLNLGLLVGGFNIYTDGLISSTYKKTWKDRTPRATVDFWKSRELWQPTWKSDMEVDYVRIWAL